MNKIIEKEQLSDNVYRMVLEAPLIAKERKPGQFIILMLDEQMGERIPLTIADADNADNTFSGDQTQTNFRVSAVSSAGESRSVAMPEIILGAPYELPFSESFAAGRPELFWWRVESDSWNKFRYVKSEPNTLGARPGADGDYGYAIFEPYDDDETTELNTGKIKTEGTTQPTLKFAYSFSSTTKGGKVEVVVAAPNKGEKVVYTATPSTTNNRPCSTVSAMPSVAAWLAFS